MSEQVVGALGGNVAQWAHRKWQTVFGRRTLWRWHNRLEIIPLMSKFVLHQCTWCMTKVRLVVVDPVQFSTHVALRHEETLPSLPLISLGTKKDDRVWNTWGRLHNTFRKNWAWMDRANSLVPGTKELCRRANLHPHLLAILEKFLTFSHQKWGTHVVNCNEGLGGLDGGSGASRTWRWMIFSQFRFIGLSSQHIRAHLIVSTNKTCCSKGSFQKVTRNLS